MLLNQLYPTEKEMINHQMQYVHVSHILPFQKKPQKYNTRVQQQITSMTQLYPHKSSQTKPRKQCPQTTP